MSHQIQEPSHTDEAGNSVQQPKRQLSSSVFVILLVITGAALFVGAYLLSYFVLTECFKEIPVIPAWFAILIIAFDIVCVVLIKFCPIRHRARAITKLAVLSVSAGVLFAVLCFWGLSV
jgi:hypothetical protein